MIQDRIGIESERYSAGKTAYVTTVTTSGTTSLVTPPAGMKVRLVWVSVIPSSDNVNANLVDVGFASTGSLYRAYVFAHWEAFEGLTEEPLTITTATAEPVSVTVHYKIVPA